MRQACFYYIHPTLQYSDLFSSLTVNCFCAVVTKIGIIAAEF